MKTKQLNPLGESSKHAPDAISPSDVVLAVDLDGTLTRSDTLHESAMRLLKDRPDALVKLPFWLLQGKARLKSHIADNVQLNPETLPYNQPLLTWLREERQKGRRMVLCTASDTRVAESVASHVDLFDEVLASDGQINNASTNKRAALDERYGPQGYDYVGNSRADLKVWEGARKAIVVDASDGTLARAKQIADVSQVFPAAGIPLKIWPRVLRIHQWLKNVLLFVPLIAAHQVTDPAALATLALAFIAFSLGASGVYVLNDMLDLESDRQHPTKRNRPFASGAVPIKYGTLLAPLCVMSGLGLAAAVNAPFFAWMVIYLLLTTLYSFKLKRYVLVDCFALAGLYTLRIVAGAAAVSILLSFWLLAFAIFLFLSLAFVKRYAELQVQAAHGRAGAHGRGYTVADAPLVQLLGIGAGYASVVVLALYLQGETVLTLYPAPLFLWGAIPLMLFWVSWVWLKAHRGEMHEDPIVFAVRDRSSLLIAGLVGACFIAATLVRLS